MRFFLIYAFLIFKPLLYGQELTRHLEKGKIINPIAIGGNNSESYAVYIPNANNGNELSAIVFIFDPNGRGELGIKSFIEASEQFNYILVCSNNAKNNNEHTVNLGIAQRFFDAVIGRFKIDRDQIYTAGFSGGARLASSIAALSNEVKGAIACGAGMEIHEGYMLDNSVFTYIGLVGDEDMNYLEMLRTKSVFDSMNVQSEVIVYEGKHRWPPPNQIKRAFTLLELNAFKNKIKNVDSVFVKNAYKEQLLLADSLKSENKLVRAMREYKFIEKYFEPFSEAFSVKEKVNSLGRFSSYQEELKLHESSYKEEKKLYSKFYDRFQLELNIGKSIDNFEWWRKNIAELDEIKKTSDTRLITKMYERLRYGIFALIVETSNVYTFNKDYVKSIYCDELLTVINPNTGFWYFRLAKSYARSNNVLGLKKNLKKAVALGFNDRSLIESTSEFKPFLNNKGIVRILSKL